MAGTTYSTEIFNTREEVVSSDLNRAQNLLSRDVQNTLGDNTRPSFSGNPSTPGSLLGNVGLPIPGLDQLPSLAPSGGFTLALGPGSGWIYNTSGITGDFSPYQVLRWGSQTVTIGAPSGNPRIDAIVATPSMTAGGTVTRNVLVDPNARTVAAQSVNKNNDPVSSISVVVGTPSATPVPPTIAATAQPLFLVYVPTTAVSSSNFGLCRYTWRRAGAPFNTMSGVVSGMGFKWDLTNDPSSSSAAVIAKGFHRVVIDGEVMEFYANMDSTVGGFEQDSAANPFGSAAPASWNKPYYIYAVGGRHNPHPSYNTSDGTFSPVTLVESLTAPNLSTGKPSSALTTGVGSVQDGAVYVGLGFVFVNTTHRAPCIMTNSMTYAGNGTASANVLSLSKAGSGSESMGTPLNKPAHSSRMYVEVDVTGSAAGSLRFTPDDGSSASPPSFGTSIVGFVPIDVVNAAETLTSGEIPCRPGDGGQVWVSGGHSTDAVALHFVGFDHGVRMFNGNVNP